MSPAFSGIPLLYPAIIRVALAELEYNRMRNSNLNNPQFSKHRLIVCDGTLSECVGKIE